MMLWCVVLITSVCALRISKRDTAGTRPQQIFYVSPMKTGSGTMRAVLMQIADNYGYEKIEWDAKNWILQTPKTKRWIVGAGGPNVEYAFARSKLKASFPKIKFIATLREPGARALSHSYWDLTTTKYRDPTEEEMLGYLHHSPNYLIKFLGLYDDTKETAVTQAESAYSHLIPIERFNEALLVLMCEWDLKVRDIMYVKKHVVMQKNQKEVPTSVKQYMQSKEFQSNPDIGLVKEAHRLLDGKINFNPKIKQLSKEYAALLRRAEKECVPCGPTRVEHCGEGLRSKHLTKNRNFTNDVEFEDEDDQYVRLHSDSDTQECLDNLTRDVVLSC